MYGFLDFGNFHVGKMCDVLSSFIEVEMFNATAINAAA